MSLRPINNEEKKRNFVSLIGYFVHLFLFSFFLSRIFMKLSQGTICCEIWRQWIDV
jgi:hypothetical protein